MFKPIKSPHTNDHRSVEMLLESSQSLWGEPTFKGLIKRFASVLNERFAVDGFSLVTLIDHGRKLSLRRSNMKFPKMRQVAEEALADLKTHVIAANINSPEFRDGYNTLQCGDDSCYLTVVERPAQGPCLLVWTKSQSAGPGDTSTGADAQTELMCLEFLVRQLQTECHWYHKLDSTQAMLYRDDLTGLYNYRYFDIALDSELRRAARFDTSFCVLFMDLDDFKSINDSHGHLSGSGVLKQVSDVIRDSVREVDVPMRYGGDEYVIVLLGASASKGVLAAERLRHRIEGTEFSLEDGGTARLTVSIGVSAFPEHGRDKENLLRIADESMYRSKRSGKNRVTLYSDRDKTGKLQSMAERRS